MDFEQGRFRLDRLRLLDKNQVRQGGDGREEADDPHDHHQFAQRESLFSGQTDALSHAFSREVDAAIIARKVYHPVAEAQGGRFRSGMRWDLKMLENSHFYSRLSDVEDFFRPVVLSFIDFALNLA